MEEKYIYAPIPGIVWRSPSPSEEDFMKEGIDFNKGDTLCLIEVMKTFNEVKAEQKGKVIKFLVENEELVEAQQKIALIEFGN